MTLKAFHSGKHRSGVIVVLAAVMIAVLVGMLSFAVDYGYLLKTAHRLAAISRRISPRIRTRLDP